MVEQHFCLRWNNYRTNITAEFETLREGEHFVDVTLACDGRQLKAHKVVLSACSPYFKELLQGNPCSHPIIILKDVAYAHMRSLLEFMYAGEVNISQAHLGSFLNTAEALKIRGLAESSEERKDGSGPNCLSPLSALKSSLGSLGGISLGGLSSPLLERPLIPQLLPHPGEPPPAPSQPPTPHKVPSSLPLPSTSYASSSSSMGLVGGKAASPEKPLPPGIDPHGQGPIPLTVNTHANDLGGTRTKGEGERERKEPPSPISLPPNKRLRPDRRLGHMGLPSRDPPGVEKGVSDKPHNGCPYSSAFSTSNSISAAAPECTAASTPPSKLGGPTITTTSTPCRTLAPEEPSADAVPKIEPLDTPVSDTEASAGWTDEVETGVGGDSYPSPEPPPPHNLSNLCSGSASAESENTSHLLQVLTSEHSHLPGEGGVASFSSAPSGPAPSREVPRSCPYCAKLISNFYNLKKHITTMHQAPTFYHACCHCSATFRTPEYLRKHLVNVHKYPVKKKK